MSGEATSYLRGNRVLSEREEMEEEGKPGSCDDLRCTIQNILRILIYILQESFWAYFRLCKKKSKKQLEKMHRTHEH